jgi:hypothetical protein
MNDTSMWTRFQPMLPISAVQMEMHHTYPLGLSEPLANAQN